MRIRRKRQPIWEPRRIIKRLEINYTVLIRHWYTSCYRNDEELNKLNELGKQRFESRAEPVLSFKWDRHLKLINGATV